MRIAPRFADNERITRSGAERKGWPRGVTVSGVGESPGCSTARLVNHRLTHCLGGAVSRWAQSMHRFSSLNNSTIRARQGAGGDASPSSSSPPLCKTTN